jgi:hypothetical protein
MEDLPKSPAKAKEKFARGRAKDTLFRVSVRNQIELIAIADNKANMITGINVILISLIIAVFGSGLRVSGELLTQKIELIIPFGILMIFCLTSAIYAILAAKPKIIKPSKSKNISLLFFHNFYRKTLEEYVEAIHTVLQSRRNTYNQMIIDMYHNGIVLERKYALLRVSYQVFLVGLVSSVAAYLITLIAV